MASLGKNDRYCDSGKYKRISAKKWHPSRQREARSPSDNQRESQTGRIAVKMLPSSSPLKNRLPVPLLASLKSQDDGHLHKP